MNKVKKGIAGISIVAMIIATAVSYIGKEEKPNNSGFKDAQFELAMSQIGWHKGNSWCVYFCKLVWSTSISNDTLRNLAMRNINGNSQVTLSNFQKDKSERFVLSDSAVPGAIVIYQEFKNGTGLPSGHAGIVIETHPGYYYTVEGNTNNNGSSNGYIVAKKKRKYNFMTLNGLRLRKFISIKQK
jgi:hypothetical protein